MSDASEDVVLVGHVNSPRKLVTLGLVVNFLNRHRPLLTPTSQSASQSINQSISQETNQQTNHHDVHSYDTIVCV